MPNVNIAEDPALAKIKIIITIHKGPFFNKSIYLETNAVKISVFPVKRRIGIARNNKNDIAAII